MENKHKYTVNIADKFGYGCGWYCDTKEEVFELLDKFLPEKRIAIAVEEAKVGFVFFRFSEEVEISNNKIGYKAS